MSNEPGDLQLLTLTDVAARLHVSATTVRAYIKRGWLTPALHIGCSLLFRSSAVEELIRFLQKSATGTGG